MLHIILLILKIIGIVLLCILGILILSVICALFVPVRYQIRLDREEGEDKPPFTAYVKVTWLLHLVNILVRYPSDVIVRVRLMLFTLFRIPEKEKKDAKKAEKPEKKTKAEKSEKKSAEEEKRNAAKIRTDTDIQQKSADESHTTDDYEAFDSGFTELESTADLQQEAESLTEHEVEPESEYAEEYDSEPAQQKADSGVKEKDSLTGKIRGIIDKIKQIVEKIKSLFENIQYTIRKFCDKIKSTLDNIEYYREVFESEPFKQSWHLCSGELKAVFKALNPDKFEAKITVGMDDPATTGEILAIYGMLYPFIGQNIQVVGDFERTHIEGNVSIRGKIRAFTFIRTAIRIYFNKDIKKLIKLLKKEAV